MKRLPFTLGLLTLIGVCVLAQQATEFQVGPDGAAAIALPAGTWELIVVSDDPEVVYPPVIRRLGHDQPPPESVVFVGTAAGYWLTVQVKDADGKQKPGVTVRATRVEPPVAAVEGFE